MARINEITSTEKLLDFIRKKSDVTLPPGEYSETFPPPVSKPPKKKAKFRFRCKAPSFRTSTVGIYIGRDYLWLAKTTKDSAGAHILLDKRQREIPPSLVKNSVEFNNFLRVELDSFCDRQKTPRIWAVLSSVGIEVGHIKVPKVPKKQLESVVYWTVKKETPFDEKENIFDFQLQGETIDQGISKWAVMYYRAPKNIIEETKKIFSNAGWPLTGLSIAPVALQNIFRIESPAGDGGGPVAHLFIGNNSSRIDIFSAGNLVMTREIKAGINSMVECLLDGVCHLPQADNKGEARQQSQIDLERARKVLSSLSPDTAPLEPNDADYGLQQQEIWQNILSSLERLVRQVERTFEYFTLAPGNEKPKKIFLSLAMNVFPQIRQYVAEQLNMECEFFDPLLRQADNDKLSYACDSERMALALAWGIAISDNAYTPNFLFTFKDKAQNRAIKRINMASFFIFMVGVSLCSGFYAYQLHAVEQRKQVMLQLKGQLPLSGASQDREELSKMWSAVKEEMGSANTYGQRYQSMAIISELSQITPQNIHFTNVKANFGKRSGAMTETVAPKLDVVAKAPDETTKRVEIEGFALGEKQALNNYFAAYIIKLENSPLFKRIKVLKTNEETFRGTAMLRFSLTMELEGI